MGIIVPDTMLKVKIIVCITYLQHERVCHAYLMALFNRRASMNYSQFREEHEKGMPTPALAS